MAYLRFQQPLVTSPTGLRLPAPLATSPMYSSGSNPNRGGPYDSNANSGGGFPPFTNTGIAGNRILPRIPPSSPPWQNREKVSPPPAQPTTPPPTPPPEISPYMATMYKSIQNIDPEQRSAYLDNTASTIKARMDQYEFRIARGIPLTPEQQRQYDSLRGAYNDIQKYINNPQPYDQLFGKWNANIAQAQANPNRVAQNQSAMSRQWSGG